MPKPLQILRTSSQVVLALCVEFGEFAPLKPLPLAAAGACIPTWQVVPSPNAAFDGNWIDALAIVASDHVWAGGGSIQQDQNHTHTLMQHWDGTQWRIVVTPDAGGITGFYVRAPDDIWAIRFAYIDETQYFLHWD